MLIKIRRIGSSHGIILNKTLLGLLGLKAGDNVKVEVNNGQLIISKCDK